MKVNVINGWGYGPPNIERYPAIDIPDTEPGQTIECELVWQVKTQTGWEEISYLGYDNRRKANEFQVRPQYNLRQVFILTPLKEQGERSGVKTATEMMAHFNSRLNNGRDYLMQVDPKDLTIEDCLIAFGYNKNGNEDF
jgi:hypothetical protein